MMHVMLNASFDITSKVIHPKYYLYTFEKKRCSPKPFGKTKNGLVSEILNKIGI